jgi:hypothetical protein
MVIQTVYKIRNATSELPGNTWSEFPSAVFCATCIVRFPPLAPVTTVPEIRRSRPDRFDVPPM